MISSSSKIFKMTWLWQCLQSCIDESSPKIQVLTFSNTAKRGRKRKSQVDSSVWIPDATWLQMRSIWPFFPFVAEIWSLPAFFFILMVKTDFAFCLYSYTWHISIQMKNNKKTPCIFTAIEFMHLWYVRKNAYRVRWKKRLWNFHQPLNPS